MINKLIAWIIPFFPEKFVWIFSKKYIAGKNFTDAVKIVRQLNSTGVLTTIDILGESMENKRQAREFQEKYFRTIEESAKKGLKTTFSLKPTMFGLLMDFDFCYKTIREIISRAARNDLMVRIDMEDSECTDPELALFKKLYNEFPANAGIVLQAYLRRTLTDLEEISRYSRPETPVNIRLCKGIYIEPRELAYRKKQEIRNNYLKCLDFMLSRNLYPALATHDKELIKKCLSVIEKHGKEKTGYEFQMLYGVTPRLRDRIVNEGHSMRIYVPFGEHWFNYSTRRLKENPHIVRDIILGFLTRK
ncbi:MAG: proline dehydrogenase family protein [Bacteroidales bacterium]|jgi:proline dehydrogenase